jgi:membrane protease YdiL (CAAX protease family)
MIDDNSAAAPPDDARLSLPAMLGYLLAAMVLVALCGGTVIALRIFFFGAGPPPPAEGQPVPLEIWVAYAALAFAVLAAYWLQGRFVEHRPRRELAPGRAGELVLGAASGIGLVLLIVLVLWGAGAYRVIAWRGPADLAGPTLMAIGAGLMEELLVRGFVLGLVERWAGSLVALAVTAILFGLLHFDNSGAGLWPVTALALGSGLALGAAYLATGRLWWSIGLHFGWNFGQSGLFGLLDSGTRFPSVVDAAVTGPYWLTGGAFGPEASLPGLAVWLLLGLVLLRRAARRGRLVPLRRAGRLPPL